MITEAHVGVGIKGVEGQQASRASDFSIGEFKLLRRLLFYHGRESYRKNSILIFYNFFKNVILCVPQFWYGITNWYSGQTLYESVNYQLYNIIYTAGPIIIYALFDRQTTDTVLMRDPIYYAPGPKRLLFNNTRYLKWFIWGSIQAFCLVYLAYDTLIQCLAV
jgi:phospholipid-transporting ATPase